MTARKAAPRKARKTPPAKPVTPEMIAALPICCNCKFFMANDNQTGICRRFPPLPFRTTEGGINSHFAPVRPVGWCGEFNRKSLSPKE